jgi:DNA-binding response OmpR family regulator
MKILIVEPDITLSRLYQTALSTSGHVVEYVCTAQDALYALEKSHPEKVILELDMPGHNGLEFLYEFSSYTDWSEIKVIIHTLLRQELFSRMKVSWSALGVSEYLYKPDTTLSALQQAVL